MMHTFLWMVMIGFALLCAVAVTGCGEPQTPETQARWNDYYARQAAIDSGVPIFMPRQRSYH